jgi:hypothetical protein
VACAWSARALSVGLAAALIFSAARSAPAAAAAAPRVTIFGDSVAQALDDAPPAKRYVAQGLDVTWRLAVCRRLVAASCPFLGERPPTVLELVRAASKGGLGATAVVDVGYNDDPDRYQADMATVIRTLLSKGVKHVVWTTMRGAREAYQRMNVAIRAEAARWRRVVLIDWDAASSREPWFTNDRIHLNHKGATGLAKLLRTAILDVTRRRQ